MKTGRVLCENCGALCEEGKVKCGLCGEKLRKANQKSVPNEAKPEGDTKEERNARETVGQECAESSNTERADAADYRSRSVLALQCWLFGMTGKHLRWLGYGQEHTVLNWENIKRNWLGLLSLQIGSVLAAAGGLLGIGSVWLAELVAVLFGKYRTDAAGKPVRWLRPKQ